MIMIVRENNNNLNTNVRIEGVRAHPDLVSYDVLPPLFYQFSNGVEGRR